VRALVLGALAIGLIAGCDVGDPEYQPVDAPAVQSLNALATLSLNDDGTPTEPAVLVENATAVVTSTSLRLRFSRFLLPSSISRQAFCLRSDTADVATFVDCANGVFLQPSYDPVKREVVLRQEAGVRLATDTLYKLTVLQATTDGECSTEEPTACGVRAFDRAALDKAYAYSFTTAETSPENAVDESAPPAVFCNPEGSFDGAAFALSGCAYSPCHAPAPALGAAEGLDFSGISNGDDLYPTSSTAINRVAHGTQMGGRADDIEETPARFGRAMPIIDAHDPGTAGSPGNSYLMYKLLVGSAAKELSSDIRPSDEEIARLRASVVVGMPMPGNSDTGMSETRLLNISNWIARGAPMEKCP